MFFLGPMRGAVYSDGRVRFARALSRSVLVDAGQCETGRWFVVDGGSVATAEFDVVDALEPIAMPTNTERIAPYFPCARALVLGGERMLVTDGRAVRSIAHLAPTDVRAARFESLLVGVVQRTDGSLSATFDGGERWSPLDPASPSARALTAEPTAAEQSPGEALERRVLAAAVAWEDEHLPSRRWQPSSHTDGRIVEFDGRDVVVRESGGALRARARVPTELGLFSRERESAMPTTDGQAGPIVVAGGCVLRAWGSRPLVVCSQTTIRFGPSGDSSSVHWAFSVEEDGTLRPVTESNGTYGSLVIDPSGESLLATRAPPEWAARTPIRAQWFDARQRAWRTVPGGVAAQAPLGVRFPYAYFDAPAGRLDLRTNGWTALEPWCGATSTVEHAHMNSSGTLLVRCSDRDRRQTVVAMGSSLNRRELGGGWFGWIGERLLVRYRSNELDFSDDGGARWFGAVVREQWPEWRVSRSLGEDRSDVHDANAPGWLHCGLDGCVFPDGSTLRGVASRSRPVRVIQGAR